MRTVQERKHASINEQPGCKRTAEHESKLKSEERMKDNVMPFNKFPVTRSVSGYDVTAGGKIDSIKVCVRA